MPTNTQVHSNARGHVGSCVSTEFKVGGGSSRLGCRTLEVGMQDAQGWDARAPRLGCTRPKVGMQGQDAQGRWLNVGGHPRSPRSAAIHAGRHPGSSPLVP